MYVALGYSSSSRHLIDIAYDINEIESGSVFAILRTSLVRVCLGSRRVHESSWLWKRWVDSLSHRTTQKPNSFPLSRSTRACVHTFVHLDSLAAADISVVAGKVNWSKRRRKWKPFPGYSKRCSNGRLEITLRRWTDINDRLIIAINDHLQFSLYLFPMD